MGGIVISYLHSSTPKFVDFVTPDDLFCTPMAVPTQWSGDSAEGRRRSKSQDHFKPSTEVFHRVDVENESMPYARNRCSALSIST